MTLVQLRHLISLAKTGSFSKSALAVFLTQPALSRSIRALETELGQPLFDRIGRHSEVTPFGREVVERALAGEPQTITRNGKTAVVVVAAAEWQRRTERKGTLADFLKASPLAGSGLQIKRIKGRLRDAGIK